MVRYLLKMPLQFAVFCRKIKGVEKQDNPVPSKNLGGFFNEKKNYMHASCSLNGYYHTSC